MLLDSFMTIFDVFIDRFSLSVFAEVSRFKNVSSVLQNIELYIKFMARVCVSFLK